MKPIRVGDRGPAVSDIQRRLSVLGRSLGPSGIDGVFLDDTVAAISAFQRDCGISATGEVDVHTWSALVDSTFAFGDRMLYLRMPYFHGSDVETLQRALSSLGFACGTTDGIFGTFTERALAEFQDNLGFQPDGVAGADTFAALTSIKHMWDGRDGISHSFTVGSDTNRAVALVACEFVLVAEDGVAMQVARRMLNMALASTTCARVRIQNGAPLSIYDEGPCVIRLIRSDEVRLDPENSIEYESDKQSMANKIKELWMSTNRERGVIVIVLPAILDQQGSKQAFQHVASTVLDALCLATA